MIGCSEQNNANNAPADSKPTTTETADQQPQSENNDQQTSNENNTHKSNGQNNHGNRRGVSVEVNNKDVSEDFLEIMQQNKESPLYPMKQID